MVPNDQQKSQHKGGKINQLLNNFHVDRNQTIRVEMRLNKQKNTKITIQKQICDVLRDLISFAQFKKREKHPLRSVTFSNVAGF